jgi:hypothetical protein
VFAFGQALNKSGHSEEDNAHWPLYGSKSYEHLPVSHDGHKIASIKADLCISGGTEWRTLNGFVM